MGRHIDGRAGLIALAALLPSVAGGQTLIQGPAPATKPPAATEAPATPPPAAQPPSASMQQRIADYRKKLAAYDKAYGAYDKVAAPYWQAVTDKRARRRAKMAKGQTPGLDDYVTTQPPVYSGPSKPKNPEDEGKKIPREIPTDEEFLANAKQHFGFVPEFPADEMTYKRAYAKVASAAGLTKEAAVKIYGFEATGNGGYDIQAGREYSRNARVISTALGYNQLLTTNTVGLVAENGRAFIAALYKAAENADEKRRAQLADKIAKLEKMIAFARTVPNDWNEHGKLANTEKGIGLHALNLDIDVGPLLQTQKLMDSVNFARRKGYTKPLTAAELEMMNLTGDGNGYDMLQMSAELREKVPTTNFFQRGGYDRNPVAARNNTVAKLMAATDAQMVQESALPGAKDLARAFDEAQ
jgi:hypothetical protein